MLHKPLPYFSWKNDLHRFALQWRVLYEIKRAFRMPLLLLSGGSILNSWDFQFVSVETKDKQTEKYRAAQIYYMAGLHEHLFTKARKIISVKTQQI